VRNNSCIVKTSPFSFKVSSHFPSVIKNLSTLYPDSLLTSSGTADFNVSVNMPFVSAIPLFKRALFSLDGFAPFTRGPIDHSHALLEWGMNWCVSKYGADRLIIHAACVARKQKAVLLSGDSGSGKSTLSCALMNESYRLLTDELTLVNLENSLVTPFVRPVSLKDKAIDVIQKRYPSAVIGLVAHNTHKGTVSHCRPSDLSWSTMMEPAEIRGIVFPKYNALATDIKVSQISSLDSFTKLLEQAFNIHILGSKAINMLQQICERTPAFEITYSDTQHAIDFVNELYESDK